MKKALIGLFCCLGIYKYTINSIFVSFHDQSGNAYIGCYGNIANPNATWVKQIEYQINGGKLIASFGIIDGTNLILGYTYTYGTGNSYIVIAKVPKDGSISPGSHVFSTTGNSIIITNVPVNGGLQAGGTNPLAALTTTVNTWSNPAPTSDSSFFTSVVTIPQQKISIT